MQFQSQSNYSSHPTSGGQNFTPEGLRALEDIAQRHGFSLDAVTTLLNALNRGNGSQAQFNHYEFGGMGQWSQGGMIMIGDMFNQNLKYRVSTLCNELSNLLRNQTVYQPPAPSQNQDNVSLYVQGSSSSNWPAEFGYASSSGAQNNLSYAFFPNARRLCIRQDGQLRTFNTGDHQISGVSQQQGGNQSLTFTSQFGLVRLIDLPEISQQPQQQPQAPQVQSQSPTNFAPQPEPQPIPPVYQEQPQSSAFSQPLPTAPDEMLKLLERLAELHKKGILTDTEFGTKKAELLSRL